MSTATIGLLVPIEAKPGNGSAVADMLVRGQKAVDAEPETLHWYGVKISDTKHAIFDTFAGESGRDAHLSGKVAAALTSGADQLAKPAEIHKVEILAAMVRPVSAGNEPKFGVYVPLVAKPEKAEEVKQFLIDALKLVQAEPETMQWYAYRKSETEFGILDTAATESGRQAHLRGEVAEALKAGKDLLVDRPNIQKCEILAYKVSA